jgi:hypothetical protein
MFLNSWHDTPQEVYRRRSKSMLYYYRRLKPKADSFEVVVEVLVLWWKESFEIPASRGFEGIFDFAS